MEHRAYTKHVPYYYWQRMVAEFKGAKGCNVSYFQGELALDYHDTRVASWDINSGTITLNHGGWLTHSTKERINRFLRVLDVGAGVTQSRKVWYVAESCLDSSRAWDRVEDSDTPEFTLASKLEPYPPKEEPCHAI
jgi:hypothetical protein